MDIEKTSLILKKINRLYELISNIGEASATEQDLLKAYVIDLYEAIAMADIEDPVDREVEEMKERIKKLKKEEKKLKKLLAKKEDARDDDENEDDDHEDDDDEIEVTAKVAVKQELESASEEAQQHTQAAANSNGHYPDELKELFQFSNSYELSDKLANAPIRDLTKAMGLNEKIFTVNELFDGNKEEMDNILMALNGLSSYDEAKSVLIRSVASKYNWSDPIKSKKAKNFIRLVRRRFDS